MSVELGCKQGESDRTPEEKCSGQSLGGLDAPVPWLDEECLPEITFLDVTCDSALPGSVSATPVTARSVNSRLTSLQPSQLSSSTNLNTTGQILCPQNKTQSPLQSNVSRRKEESETLKTKPYKENGPKTLSETSSSDSMSDKENNSEACSPVLSKHNGTTASEALDAYMVDPSESMYAPVRWLDVRYYPEITLLDVTHDSEASPKGDLSSMDITRDTSPVENNMPPSEFSEQIAAEPGRSDTIQNEESSSTLTGNVTHTTSSLSERSDKSVENITQNSLEVTRNISAGSVVENGPNMVKIQTSAEKTLGTNPANVTHDISSSSDVSVRSAASQFSTSDTQCNTTSKNVTSEHHGETVVTSNTVEANNEELLTSHDELISKVPQSSPKTSGSVNSTFTSLQPSELSSSTTLNTTTQISGSQNKTLDLPSSNVNSETSLIMEREATDQATSVSKNTTETSLIMASEATDQATSVSKNTTKTSLIMASEATDQATPVSKNTTETSLIMASEATDQAIPVSKNTTETSLIMESEATDQATSVSKNTTKPSLIMESEATDQATSVSKNTTETSVIMESEATDQATPVSKNTTKTSLIMESEATDQATSVSKNSTDTSLSMNQNCSAVKTSGACDMQNATFDRHSLQKSSGNTILGVAGAATFCLQNNTFDTKPPSKQNGTITLSETSSSDSHQSTFDKPSSIKVCNATSSPKENNSKVHSPVLSKPNGTTDSTEPTAKMVVTPESTFDGNPSVKVASGTGRRETKDHSQSALSLTAGLSDTLSHQSMDAENNKANTFNWDDPLDLKADFLITSTPMTNCKISNLNTQREEGKILGAQKKLYRDGSSKTDAQVPSDVPSNLACDRKTFLTRPAAKSLLPPSKAASQLLKHKPASALLTTLTSGLPRTRQRTQAEALRNTAASESPQTTGISSSYKLRATTTGSKQQPNLGLQRLQLSGIPSSIQKAATGLRPPSARSNASASSSANKLRGPTATNTVTKTSQAKRPPLTRGETLPIAKRKKMDAPLPSCAEVSTSSCDAANGARSLKQPTTNKRALPAKTPRDDAAVPASTFAEISTSCDGVSRARAMKQPVTSHRALLAKPKGQGCSNCVVLEQQLRRLKEELLKKSKEEQEG